jgi:hypothetical protein
MIDLTDLAKRGARVFLTYRNGATLETTLDYVEENKEWPIRASNDDDLCWRTNGEYNYRPGVKHHFDIVSVTEVTGPAPPKIIQIAAYGESEDVSKGMVALGSDGSLHWICCDFTSGDWYEIPLPPGFAKS